MCIKKVKEERCPCYFLVVISLLSCLCGTVYVVSQMNILAAKDNKFEERREEGGGCSVAAEWRKQGAPKAREGKRLLF